MLHIFSKIPVFSVALSLFLNFFGAIRLKFQIGLVEQNFVNCVTTLNLRKFYVIHVNSINCGGSRKCDIFWREMRISASVGVGMHFLQRSTG